MDKLRACQNTWNLLKIIYIKMWEIELLNNQNEKLGISIYSHHDFSTPPIPSLEAFKKFGEDVVAIAKWFKPAA